MHLQYTTGLCNQLNQYIMTTLTRKVGQCIGLCISTILLCFFISSCDVEDLETLESENLVLDKSHSKKASGASASGQGTLFIPDEEGNPDGITRHFSFHSRLMPNGNVDGGGQLTYTAGQLKIKYTIDCMRIEGNEAFMTGTITKYSTNPERVGWDCWFRVVDNGQGNNAEPDGLTRLLIGPDLFACDITYGLLVNTVEGGNIQVKP